MGTAWSARLLQFSLGILVMLVLSYTVLGETLTMKNAVSLLLCFCVVLIQLLWK